jgi:hypothetical protein
MRDRGGGDRREPAGLDARLVTPARRSILGLLGIAAAASFLDCDAAHAKDYGSATEALDEIDRLESDVVRRLSGLAAESPAARNLAQSLIDDHRRHAAERAWVRRLLGAASSRPVGAASTERPQSVDDQALQALRSNQEALVYAHAEGLPALGDARAVSALARHLVDLSRHLTVIDLWLETEGGRG